MIGDIWYFQKRHDSLEREFIGITDYVPLTPDFEDPNYKFGSFKLMDFSFKVCMEVETMFTLLLEDSSFDGKSGIGEARKRPNITEYGKFIESKYRFHEYKLNVKDIDREIVPFENFENESPSWFRAYSGGKHFSLELIKTWTLKDCLLSLGALALLVLNHPDIKIKDKSGPFSTDYESILFYGKNVSPRFSWRDNL